VRVCLGAKNTDGDPGGFLESGSQMMRVDTVPPLKTVSNNVRRRAALKTGLFFLAMNTKPRIPTTKCTNYYTNKCITCEIHSHPRVQ
jgi:hypothetical protein